MLHGENCVHETYYEILSVKEDASYEEIRNSYRSAILHSHPDKLLNSSRRSSDDEKFLKIQKAWEVLSDAELRVVYDNDLRSSRHDGITADEISIEDMSVEISGEEEEGGEVIEVFYQCRCGDYFCVDSSELGTMGFGLVRDGGFVRVKRLGAFVASVVLPCGSCSLKTRVWVDSDMKISLQDDDQL
ncbi:PREDICTED: DPH4 homolog [Camelina sativa]|uniref:DPH4 homolog n=1 Tax=Camelina sativa TaxID=90675 RepID=A0ABM1QBB5_CAMSA|nr:PREDICTED: DPH4 homolog [Camelina sativa]